VVVGLLVVAAALYVEARVAVEPVVPLRLFRDRTTALATVASVLVGLAMFGSTVYLSQYFQLSRGMSPTMAGLMSVAMVGGLLVSSIVTGRIITRTGRWKRYLVAGMVLVIAGLSLLAGIDDTTSLWYVGGGMAVLGLGLGGVMQNLVLSVQNNVAQSDLGAASSLVAFFRSMGGSIGVAALGALLSHQVADKVAAALSRLGIAVDAHRSGDIPDVSSLDEPFRSIFEHAFTCSSSPCPSRCWPWSACCSSRRSRSGPRSCGPTRWRRRPPSPHGTGDDHVAGRDRAGARARGGRAHPAGSPRDR
jgi:hypothetical protein